MRASHKGDCVGCGDRIDIGDEIFWVSGGGARCEDCGPHNSEPSGSATGMEDAPGYVRVLEKRIARLEERREHELLVVMRRIDVLFTWATALAVELAVDPPREGSP